MISGFDGRGRLNFGSTGHAAVRHRVPHGLAEVERAAVAVPPALREPGRERTRQRVDRLLQLLHLLARRVHEVDVFGQRLAQRARHRLDAAVGDEPAADLGLDHLLQDLEPAFEVFRASRSSNAPSPIAVVLLGLLHHLADETVGVELPQRAVEVVRAADRPARLHAREARDRGAPRACAAARVHAHQRVEEHLRELFVGHLAHRAAAVHRGAELLEVGLRVGADLRPFAVLVDAGAEDREVHLEHRVEHLVVPVVLHERRAERGLERVAVVERHVLDRAHRVEVLGHRHRQAREPELVHEALQHVEHVGSAAHGGHAFIARWPPADSA